MNTFIIGSLALLCTILLVMVILRPRKNAHSSASIETLQEKLEEILWLFRVPKMRGTLGEQLLEQLLSDWLPRSTFSVQYGFRNGTRVDAVVRMGKRMVAIDSKFPLEQVAPLLEKADETNEMSKALSALLLKYADSIAERYIQPNEGTTHFALLYIPSESIYYRCFVVHGSSLFSEFWKKQVIPVSPGTLFLYLQTMAAGIRESIFSEKRHKILQKIQQLKVESSNLSKQLNTSSTHLRNLEKSWDQLMATSRRVEESTDRIMSGEDE